MIKKSILPWGSAGLLCIVPRRRLSHKCTVTRTAVAQAVMPVQVGAGLPGLSLGTQNLGEGRWHGAKVGGEEGGSGPGGGQGWGKRLLLDPTPSCT